MFRHVIAMVVAFALTVVSSVAAGHAMRMNDASQVAHASHMTAAKASDGRACQGHQACDPASAELCAFMCASLLSFVFPDPDVAFLARLPAGHDLAVTPTIRGHDPGRDDRPPISHLL